MVRDENGNLISGEQGVYDEVYEEVRRELATGRTTRLKEATSQLGNHVLNFITLGLTDRGDAVQGRSDAWDYAGRIDDVHQAAVSTVQEQLDKDTKDGILIVKDGGSEEAYVADLTSRIEAKLEHALNDPTVRAEDIARETGLITTQLVAEDCYNGIIAVGDNFNTAQTDPLDVALHYGNSLGDIVGAAVNESLGDLSPVTPVNGAERGGRNL